MRYVVGCMSGTSIDGIDAALVAIDGHGLEMQCSVESFASQDFDPQLASALRRLAEQEAMNSAEIALINADFSRAHVAVINACCGSQTPNLIAVHGQTIFHQAPLSWQLINPSIISQEMHCDVVSDLRAADLARGGEGAPMTPIADYILFQSNNERRAVINLGGFCNITQLPTAKNTDAIHGFDLCACNHILDYIARLCFNADYDENGVHAQSGSLHQNIATEILRALQDQSAGRSLGTGDELLALIRSHAQDISGYDLANCACWAIAQCIYQSCADYDVLICAGGGCANACLMEYLNKEIKTVTSDQFNIPIQQREAIAMAILGALSQDKVPITLKQITHVDRAPIAGCWTYYS